MEIIIEYAQKINYKQNMWKNLNYIYKLVIKSFLKKNLLNKNIYLEIQDEMEQAKSVIINKKNSCVTKRIKLSTIDFLSSLKRSIQITYVPYEHRSIQIT